MKKVLGNFSIDISLQLLEQFHQINNHFKEHLKVYLLCKNKGSNSRSKRESIKKVYYMRFWFSKNNSLMLNNQKMKQISFILHIRFYFFDNKN
jgi:hypothetical protein